MKKIILLSDTHSYLDQPALELFQEPDEIWHAGDIGNRAIIEKLQEIAPVRAVYGNIDGPELRGAFPLHQRFTLEGVDVWMTHIGGYPGRYDRGVRDALRQNPPRLFICGHSHILRVMNDAKLGLLHMNPGALGKQGFHQVRTLLRFKLREGRIEDLEVAELKR